MRLGRQSWRVQLELMLNLLIRRRRDVQSHLWRQTVFTDLPPHASLYFKRKDKLVCTCNELRLLTSFLNSVRTVSAFHPTHGMTIHHDKSCHDKELMNDSILWLMGHKFDSWTLRSGSNHRHHHIVNHVATRSVVHHTFTRFSSH
jgi:hypothetical protein